MYSGESKNGEMFGLLDSWLKTKAEYYERRKHLKRLKRKIDELRKERDKNFENIISLDT